MRYNVVDCDLRTYVNHKGEGQIIPTAIRLYFTLELLSSHTLLQHISNCDITISKECMGGVYQSLNTKRGQVIETIQISGAPWNLINQFFIQVKAYFFVSESFFSQNCQEKELKENILFDHQQIIKGFPLVDQKATDLVMLIGKKKTQRINAKCRILH